MRTRSADTTPEAEQVLINLLRKKSISEKLKSVLSLSALSFQLSKRIIKRANPEKSKIELDMIFLELHYGKAIADKVKYFLNNQDNGSK